MSLLTAPVVVCNQLHLVNAKSVSSSEFVQQASARAPGQVRTRIDSAGNFRILKNNQPLIAFDPSNNLVTCKLKDAISGTSGYTKQEVDALLATIISRVTSLETFRGKADIFLKALDDSIVIEGYPGYPR